jgi:hypoxanthine phosphoribosyltransferase
MTIRVLADRLSMRRYDLIVGIPRGGLAVALALAYDLRVAHVASYSVKYVRPEGGGPPSTGAVWCAPASAHLAGKEVLVVEDGTITGTLLEHAARYCRTHVGPRGRVTTAAIWVSTRHGYRPDFWSHQVAEVPVARVSVTGERA